MALTLPSNSAISAAGERFTHYSEHSGDRQILETYREFRCQGLEVIYHRLAECLSTTPSVLSLRVKRIDSIIRKLRREGSMKVVQMDDVIGFRIITGSYSYENEIARCVSNLLTIRRPKDYLNTTPVSGYRAMHLILTQELGDRGSGTTRSYPYELQIRTYYQHLWATMSESFGEQVKEGGGGSKERDYLGKLSALIRDWELENPDLQQIDGLSTSEGLLFFVLHFDKVRGALIHLHDFDLDPRTALKHLLYLEELHRHDLGRESVLAAACNGLEGLKVTHLRYFYPKGIPPLPAFLTPASSRP